MWMAHGPCLLLQFSFICCSLVMMFYGSPAKYSRNMFHWICEALYGTTKQIEHSKIWFLCVHFVRTLAVCIMRDVKCGCSEQNMRTNYSKVQD